MANHTILSCACDPITYDITTTASDCGQNNGTVTISNVVNGTTPNGNTSQTFSSLGAGSGTIQLTNNDTSCANQVVGYNIGCNTNECPPNNTCNNLCQCNPDDCPNEGDPCTLGNCYSTGSLNSSCECVGSSPCNTPPTISCPNTISINPGQSANWNVSASDPCTGNSLAVTCQPYQSGITFDCSGTYSVSCESEAGCNGLTASCNFNIQVASYCAGNPCQGDCGDCKTTGGGCGYRCDCTGGSCPNGCSKTGTDSNGKDICDCDAATPCSPDPCTSDPCTRCENDNCVNDCSGSEICCNTGCLNPCTSDSQGPCCCASTGNQKIISQSCTSIGGTWDSNNCSCTPPPTCDNPNCSDCTYCNPNGSTNNCDLNRNTITSCNDCPSGNCCGCDGNGNCTDCVVPGPCDGVVCTNPCETCDENNGNCVECINGGDCCNGSCVSSTINCSGNVVLGICDCCLDNYIPSGAVCVLDCGAQGGICGECNNDNDCPGECGECVNNTCQCSGSCTSSCVETGTNVSNVKICECQVQPSCDSCGAAPDPSDYNCGHTEICAVAGVGTCWSVSGTDCPGDCGTCISGECECDQDCGSQTCTDTGATNQGRRICDCQTCANDCVITSSSFNNSTCSYNSVESNCTIISQTSGGDWDVCDSPFLITVEDSLGCQEVLCVLGRCPDGTVLGTCPPNTKFVGNTSVPSSNNNTGGCSCCDDGNGNS